MDKQLIREKLESLRHCIDRIEDKCPNNPSTLQSDLDIQDIISLNLTRAVQICVDIAAHLISSSSIQAPFTMGAAFDQLVELGYLEEVIADKMKKSVGFRNVAVHSYDKINWDIVFSICNEHLDDFKIFARSMSIVLDSSQKD